MTVVDILETFGLVSLIEGIYEFSLRASDLITRESPVSLANFQEFLQAHFEEIKEIYRSTNELYAAYLREMFQGMNRVALVDLGWRGVNGVMIGKFAAQNNLQVSMVNFLAGAKQPVNLPQIRRGEIRVWMFSPENNYAALKQHKEEDNMLFELMCMSPSPTFHHFCSAADGRVTIAWDFATVQDNQTIRRVQRGILDFVREYKTRFAAFPEFLQIPAADATELLYPAMRRNHYFRKFFGSVSFSREIGNDSQYTVANWI